MSDAIDLLAQAVKDAGLVMTLNGRVVTADELKRRAFERAVERLAQSTGVSEDQARADAPAGLNDRRGKCIDGAEVRLRFRHEIAFGMTGRSAVEHRMSVEIDRGGAQSTKFTLHAEGAQGAERLLLRRLLSAVVGEMLGDPEGARTPSRRATRQGR